MVKKFTKGIRVRERDLRTIKSNEFDTEVFIWKRLEEEAGFSSLPTAALLKFVEYKKTRHPDSDIIEFRISWFEPTESDRNAR